MHYLTVSVRLVITMVGLVPGTPNIDVSKLIKEHVATWSQTISSIIYFDQ